MRTCYSILPDRFADGRHAAILAGFGRHGFHVEHHAAGNVPAPRDERDVLVSWTRHRGHKARACDAFEAGGGRVLICEEGYIQRARGDQKHFALSWRDHNGAGDTPNPPAGATRFESFGIEVQPWRAPGELVIVREQRGIGSEHMASPPGWHQRVATDLRARGYSVLERQHPKRRAGGETLEQLARNALAVVTWASSIAGKALILGVPVVRCAPHSIVEAACGYGLEALDDLAAAPGLYRDDPARAHALERLAWGQWSMAEIVTGRALEALLAI